MVLPWFGGASHDCRVQSEEGLSIVALRCSQQCPNGFPAVTNAYARILRRSGEEAAAGVVVDVGANIGWFALLCAAQGRRVVAVEPMEYNYELLLASASAREFSVHTER